MIHISLPPIPLFASLRAGFVVAMLLPLVLGPARADASPAPAFRLLAFGDSLIHGYGLAAG